MSMKVLRNKTTVIVPITKDVAIQLHCRTDSLAAVLEEKIKHIVVAADVGGTLTIALSLETDI